MTTAIRIAALLASLAAGACLAQTPAPVDAKLLEVKGSVLVNQGEVFEEAGNGTSLKANDRVMAMENARAEVRFFEGCEMIVEPGEVVVVPEQLPCHCGNFEKEDGPVARLAELTGDASLKDGDMFNPVALGLQLKVGDLVRIGEGSSAVVEFRDGCRQEVAGGTDYQIPDSSPCACAMVPAMVAGTTPMTAATWARLIIPPIIIIGISLPDNDGPISP